jgi:hypothetical protein
MILIVLRILLQLVSVLSAYFWTQTRGFGCIKHIVAFHYRTLFQGLDKSLKARHARLKLHCKERSMSDNKNGFARLLAL